MGLFGSVFLGLITVLVALLAPTVIHWGTIAGPFLTPKPTVLGEGQGLIYIDDTVHCEDVHHYTPANLLFTACEDLITTRFDWFPGLGHLEAEAAGRGSIHVIDPKNMKSSRLAFENFQSNFVTHGIDVIADPKHADSVYIFAINHLPNPAFLAASTEERQDIPAARSQIELFHHVLHSKTVRHVRSIRHPLIYTPNDISAVSPSEFYVTNDHYYRDGIKRAIEDLWPFAKWSYTVNVQIDDLDLESGSATAVSQLDPESELRADIALSGLWNNNGLGHGRSDDEIVISSAIGAELYLAKVHSTNHTLSVHTTIPFDTVTDNPSYYADPYASEGNDASGFVVAGVSQGIYLAQTGHDIHGKDPMQVWYTRQNGSGKWENRLLFEDDSERIRTASAAVLVPIEPEAGAQKQAWLFVTGFLSEKMIAVKVDL